MKRFLLVTIFTVLCASMAWGQSTPGTVRFPNNLDDQDSLIRVKDNSRALLTVSMTTGSAQVTVDSTASFAATGVLQLDNEQIAYTAKISTAFTGLTRGAFGTTAATHTINTSVRGVIAAIHHTVLADALRAIEAKLGLGTGAPLSSYVLVGTPSGSVWRLLTSSDVPTALPNRVLTTPIINGGTINGSAINSSTLETPMINNPTINGALTLPATVNVTTVNATNGNFTNVTGNGAGLTGVVGSGTVQMINPTNTTLGADSDNNGSGILDLQMRGATSQRINNDGSVTFFTPLTGTTSFFYDKGATVYDVRAFGATPNNSTDSDTVAIQAAITAASTAGGGTVLLKGGIFDVTKSTTILDENLCLYMGSNVHLQIDTSATLRVKSGQLTGTTPSSYLHLLVVNGDRMLIDGGGRMTGNTAGQTGYSGGFTQSGSNLITGGGTNLTIKDLTMDDNFGNPINLQNSDASRGRNVRIENISCDNVGEGIQVTRTDGVTIAHIFQRNTNSVQQGDAVEVGNCTDFVIDDIHFSNMTGIDIFCSQKGTVSNFVGQNVSPGIEIHDFGIDNGGPSTDVDVVNGLIIESNAGDANNIQAVVLDSQDGSLRNINLSNVTVRGNSSTYAFLIGNNIPSLGPITLSNCNSFGSAKGLSIGTVDHVTVTGGNFNDGVNTVGSGTPHAAHGISYEGALHATSSSQTAQLNLSGVTATGNSGYGFSMNDGDSSSYDAYAPSGSITSCNFQNNTLGMFSAGDTASLSRLSITNNTPRVSPVFYNGSPIGLWSIMQPVNGSGTNSTMTSLSNPSFQQQIILQFTEDKIIPDSAPFDLAGSGSVQFHADQWLCLVWDGSVWHELWRRTT
jgi:hypothetical protein